MRSGITNQTFGPTKVRKRFPDGVLTPRSSKGFENVLIARENSAHTTTRPPRFSQRLEIPEIRQASYIATFYINDLPSSNAHWSPDDTLISRLLHCYPDRSFGSHAVLCSRQARLRNGSFKQALCFKPTIPFHDALRFGRRSLQNTFSCVVSGYLVYICHAFGSIFSGYLCELLDVSYRFCVSPLLLLTQLLQCSIARQGPSKKVYF